MMLFLFLQGIRLAIAAGHDASLPTRQPSWAAEHVFAQTTPAQPTAHPPVPGSPRSTYAVEGLTLGARLSLDSAGYREYQCVPSEQFPGFTWCTKKRNGSERRGNFEASYSVLHAPDGTVVYANRFQTPAYWTPTEVDDDIQHYSRTIGAQPNIIQMPSRPALPKGTIATWGKVTLQPLDGDSLKALAEGKAVRKGLLVDFIGDFTRSAREELPVYRISGGAGFVWIASRSENGRGTLRFAAVDPSSYSMPALSNLKPLPTPQQDNPLREKQGEDPARLAYADITAETLEKSQHIRDILFKDLKGSTTRYTFEYVVINLPPGTLPGVNISVPVSHVRYNSSVFFAFDRYSLEPGAEATVSDFAKTILKDKSYRSILVVGHTDSIGTDEYNYSLSKNRAVTVALALHASGIPEKFLGVVPMGKVQPLTTNSTPQGRALNRRVEFFISDVPGAPDKVIEGTPVNPCYRNDHETAGGSPPDCTGGPTRIPILPPSGEGTPQAMLDLSRSPLPNEPGISREPLPHELIERPSIRELQPDK